jgi:biotin operon repressor
MNRPTCRVTGCAAIVLARGYCPAHYRRWQRHGDPQAGVPVQMRAASGSSYWSVHQRLTTQHGPAAAQGCAECPASAAVWSYDGTDPGEMTHPTRGYRYSLDLARYRSRCRTCHRQATVARRGPRLDSQRVARLYRAGASGPGIAAYLGVSRATVYRALRSHGVPIRSRTTRHRKPDINPQTTHTITSQQHPPDLD